MTLVVPNVGEVDVLQKFLATDVELRLFSNNKTPAESDTAASYTEVAGGGYARITLASGDWTITGGAPSKAVQTAKDFTFTGATSAPSTVYGYYVIRGSVLLWAERFNSTVVPVIPVNGTLIRITPKFEAS